MSDETLSDEEVRLVLNLKHCVREAEEAYQAMPDDVRGDDPRYRKWWAAEDRRHAAKYALFAAFEAGVTERTCKEK